MNRVIILSCKGNASGFKHMDLPLVKFDVVRAVEYNEADNGSTDSNDNQFVFHPEGKCLKHAYTCSVLRSNSPFAFAP